MLMIVAPFAILFIGFCLAAESWQEIAFVIALVLIPIWFYAGFALALRKGKAS